MDDLIWAIKKALLTRAHLGVIRFLIDVKKNFFETSMHHLIRTCHFLAIQIVVFTFRVAEMLDIEGRETESSRIQGEQL